MVWGERPSWWAEQRQHRPCTAVWSSLLAASGKNTQFGNKLYHHRMNCLQQRPWLPATIIKMNLSSSELIILCIQQQRSILHGTTVEIAIAVKTPVTSRKLHFQNSLSKMFSLQVNRVWAESCNIFSSPQVNVNGEWHLFWCENHKKMITRWRNL